MGTGVRTRTHLLGVAVQHLTENFHQVFWSHWVGIQQEFQDV